MDDDERDDEQDAPEPEPRIFTLPEAEKTRKEVEPVLIEAIEFRRKIEPLVRDFAALSSRIMLMGGIQVPYEKLAQQRLTHDRLAESLRAALRQIQSTGCVVKDLDSGLLDFPAIIDNQEVYLCWRLGEDRIRFYHSQREGFAGRKPLDPRDAGPSNPIQ
jgi:hypothetical protein